MRLIVPDGINGIDISSANTILDVKKIVGCGMRFVYLQASRYSTETDPPFWSRLKLLRTNAPQLALGAYHFCSHDTDPEAQAQHFFRSCGGLGMAIGELPPMIDWEHCTAWVYANKPGGHKEHCVRWLLRFKNEVRRLWNPPDRVKDVFPFIYTYPNYGREHQPNLSQCPEIAEDTMLCYASYREPGGQGYVPASKSELPYPEHAVPAPFKGAAMVQYSGNVGVQVPGMGGPTDRLCFLGNEVEYRILLSNVA